VPLVTTGGEDRVTRVISHPVADSAVPAGAFPVYEYGAVVELRTSLPGAVYCGPPTNVATAAIWEPVVCATSDSFRAAVPTVLSTAMPAATALAAGTAKVPVLSLFGP